ncbi:MAG: 5'/3'-nucleotidase SurE [Planctomycetaceae bacterium]|nr:5'/3'-nucleotidase SurE [Planctomycetaceae bacterium]
MQFLITNDDGYDAPGLAALYHALKPIGDVVVVAPAKCHSSKGHAVDTKNPIRIERRNVEPFGEIYIVHSSPADCIRVGLRHVLSSPPDRVVAGINPGANLGVDLYYSGTAAAAREAALMNVPAIATSRYFRDDAPIDWEILGKHVNRVVRRLLEPQFDLPVGHFWNVNFPAIPGEIYPNEISFVPHGSEPHAVSFEVVEEDGQSQVLRYSAMYRDRGRSETCDVRHLFDNQLTATAVGPHTTANQQFPHNSEVSPFRAVLPD